MFHLLLSWFKLYRLVNSKRLALGNFDNFEYGSASLIYSSFTTNVSKQGPFQSERAYGSIYGDLLANSVAWTKVVWVEGYEDDNGQMINTLFSPELN